MSEGQTMGLFGSKDQEDDTRKSPTSNDESIEVTAQQHYTPYNNDSDSDTYNTEALSAMDINDIIGIQNESTAESTLESEIAALSEIITDSKSETIATSQGLTGKDSETMADIEGLGDTYITNVSGMYKGSGSEDNAVSKRERSTDILTDIGNTSKSLQLIGEAYISEDSQETDEKDEETAVDNVPQSPNQQCDDTEKLNIDAELRSMEKTFGNSMSDTQDVTDRSIHSVEQQSPKEAQDCTTDSSENTHAYKNASAVLLDLQDSSNDGKTAEELKNAVIDSKTGLKNELTHETEEQSGSFVSRVTEKINTIRKDTTEKGEDLNIVETSDIVPANILTESKANTMDPEEAAADLEIDSEQNDEDMNNMTPEEAKMLEQLIEHHESNSEHLNIEVRVASDLELVEKDDSSTAEEFEVLQGDVSKAPHNETKIDDESIEIINENKEVERASEELKCDDSTDLVVDSELPSNQNEELDSAQLSEKDTVDTSKNKNNPIIEQSENLQSFSEIQDTEGGSILDPMDVNLTVEQTSRSPEHIPLPSVRECEMGNAEFDEVEHSETPGNLASSSVSERVMEKTVPEEIQSLETQHNVALSSMSEQQIEKLESDEGMSSETPENIAFSSVSEQETSKVESEEIQLSENPENVALPPESKREVGNIEPEKDQTSVTPETVAVPEVGEREKGNQSLLTPEKVAISTVSDREIENVDSEENQSSEPRAESEEEQSLGNPENVALPSVVEQEVKNTEFEGDLSLETPENVTLSSVRTQEVVNTELDEDQALETPENIALSSDREEVVEKPESEENQPPETPESEKNQSLESPEFEEEKPFETPRNIALPSASERKIEYIETEKDQSLETSENVTHSLVSQQKIRNAESGKDQSLETSEDVALSLVGEPEIESTESEKNPPSETAVNIAFSSVSGGSVRKVKSEEEKSLEISDNISVSVETDSMQLLNTEVQQPNSDTSELESAVKFLQESEEQVQDSPLVLSPKMIERVTEDITEETGSLLFPSDVDICEEASDLVRELQDIVPDPIAISEAEIVSETAKLENEHRVNLAKQITEATESVAILAESESKKSESLRIVEESDVSGSTDPSMVTEALNPLEEIEKVCLLSQGMIDSDPKLSENISMSSEETLKVSILEEKLRETPKIEIPTAEVSLRISDSPTTPKTSLLIQKDLTIDVEATHQEMLESPKGLEKTELKIVDTQRKDSEKHEFENVGSPKIILKLAESALADCGEPRSPKSPKIRSATNSPNPEDSPDQKLEMIKLKLSEGSHPSIISNETIDEATQRHSEGTSSSSPIGLKIKFPKLGDASIMQPEYTDDLKEPEQEFEESKRPESPTGMEIKFSKTGDASIVQQESKDSEPKHKDKLEVAQETSERTESPKTDEKDEETAPDRLPQSPNRQCDDAEKLSIDAELRSMENTFGTSISDTQDVTDGSIDSVVQQSPKEAQDCRTDSSESTHAYKNASEVLLDLQDSSNDSKTAEELKNAEIESKTSLKNELTHETEKQSGSFVSQVTDKMNRIRNDTIEKAEDLNIVETSDIVPENISTESKANTMDPEETAADLEIDSEQNNENMNNMTPEEANMIEQLIEHHETSSEHPKIEDRVASDLELVEKDDSPTAEEFEVLQGDVSEELHKETKIDDESIEIINENEEVERATEELKCDDSTDLVVDSELPTIQNKELDSAQLSEKDTGDLSELQKDSLVMSGETLQTDGELIIEASKNKNNPIIEQSVDVRSSSEIQDTTGGSIHDSMDVNLNVKQTSRTPEHIPLPSVRECERVMEKAEPEEVQSSETQHNVAVSSISERQIEKLVSEEEMSSETPENIAFSSVSEQETSKVESEEIQLSENPENVALPPVIKQEVGNVEPEKEPEKELEKNQTLVTPETVALPAVDEREKGKVECEEDEFSLTPEKVTISTVTNREIENVDSQENQSSVTRAESEEEQSLGTPENVALPSVGEREVKNAESEEDQSLETPEHVTLSSVRTPEVVNTELDEDQPSETPENIALSSNREEAVEKPESEKNQLLETLESEKDLSLETSDSEEDEPFETSENIALPSVSKRKIEYKETEKDQSLETPENVAHSSVSQQAIRNVESEKDQSLEVSEDVALSLVGEREMENTESEEIPSSETAENIAFSPTENIAFSPVSEGNVRKVESEEEKSLETPDNIAISIETDSIQLQNTEVLQPNSDISELESAVKFLQESEEQVLDSPLVLSPKMVERVTEDITEETGSPLFLSDVDICEEASDLVRELQDIVPDPIAISEAEIISEAAKLENERRVNLAEQITKATESIAILAKSESKKSESLTIVEESDVSGSTDPSMATEALNPLEEIEKVCLLSQGMIDSVPKLSENILTSSEKTPKVSILEERLREPPKIEIPTAEVSLRISDSPTTPKTSLLIQKDLKVDVKATHQQMLESPKGLEKTELKIVDTPRKESEKHEFENVGSPRIILKIAKSALADCGEPRSPKSPKIRSATNSPNPEDSPGQKLGKIKLKLSKGGHPSIISNETIDEATQRHSEGTSSPSPIGMKIKFSKSGDASIIQPENTDDLKEPKHKFEESKRTESPIGMKIKFSKTGDPSIVQQESKDSGPKHKDRSEVAQETLRRTESPIGMKIKLSKTGDASIIPPERQELLDESKESTLKHREKLEITHEIPKRTESPIGMKIKLSKTGDASIIPSDSTEDSKECSVKSKEKVELNQEIPKRNESPIGMKIKLSKTRGASIVQLEKQESIEESKEKLEHSPGGPKRTDSPIGVKIKLSKTGDASIIHLEKQEAREESKETIPKHKEKTEILQETSKRTESPIGMKIKVMKSGEASIISQETFEESKNSTAKSTEKPETTHDVPKRTESLIGVKIKLSKTGDASIIHPEKPEDLEESKESSSKSIEKNESSIELPKRTESPIGMKIKLSKSGDASIISLDTSEEPKDSLSKPVDKTTVSQGVSKSVESPIGMKIKLSKTGDASIVESQKKDKLTTKQKEKLTSQESMQKRNKDIECPLEMKIKFSKTGHPTIVASEKQESFSEISQRGRDPLARSAAQKRKESDLAAKEPTLKLLKTGHSTILQGNRSELTIEPVQSHSRKLQDISPKRKEVTISPIETKKSKLEAKLSQILPEVTIQPVMSRDKKQIIFDSKSNAISRQQMNVISQEISITQVPSSKKPEMSMSEKLKSMLSKTASGSPTSSDCEIIETKPDMFLINENSNSSQDVMIIEEVPRIPEVKIPKKRGRPRRNPLPPVLPQSKIQIHPPPSVVVPHAAAASIETPHALPIARRENERPKRTCKIPKSYAPPRRGRGRGRGKRTLDKIDISVGKKPRLDDLTDIERSTTSLLPPEEPPIHPETPKKSSELYKALKQPSLLERKNAAAEARARKKSLSEKRKDSTPVQTPETKTSETKITETKHPETKTPEIITCKDSTPDMKTEAPTAPLSKSETEAQEGSPTESKTDQQLDPAAVKESSMGSKTEESAEKLTTLNSQKSEPVIFDGKTPEKSTEDSKSPSQEVKGAAGDAPILPEPQNWLTPSSKKQLEAPSKTELISTVQVIDEETRMSAESGSRSQTPARNISGPATETTINEESQGSVLSTATTESEKVKVKNRRMEINFDPDEGPFTVDKIAEYEWPLDRKGDTFMIQEQISQYLGVKSFKRKYPDLKRRMVEMEERNYLRENALVSEAMCDMGLTAVSSQEVLDVMCSDFPDQYEEYRKHMREKQIKEHSKKQKELTAAANAERNRIDLAEMAVQSALSWNVNLNKARRESRKCSLDLQTFTIHVPKKQQKVEDEHKVAHYPVALIPGQYTNYYREYTPAELRYYPLNTVLYGPMKPNERQFDSQSDGSQSDSDSDSSSDDSSSSSSEGTQDTEESQSTMDEIEMEVVQVVPKEENKNLKCKMCLKNLNKHSKTEVLIQCGTCTGHVHPSCIDLTLDMVPHIRRYAWQCTDCKTCAQCHDPADEDKMLFCDMCDRGYHIYCVGLRRVPQGRWHCQECAICANCGSKEPGGANSDRNSVALWQHEYKKGERNTRVYVSTLCVPCSKLWRKGRYCPHCSRCHSAPRLDLEANLVQCSACDKYLHLGCVETKGAVIDKKNYLCEFCTPNRPLTTRPLVSKTFRS